MTKGSLEVVRELWALDMDEAIVFEVIIVIIDLVALVIVFVNDVGEGGDRWL